MAGSDLPGVPPATGLSIVTPAYNEAGNLDLFYERLAAVLPAQAGAWEWIVVDDHSGDATFDVVARLAARDPRVRGLRLARNSGSHVAIGCGLHHATGAAAIILAADLQDPPEMLPRLLEAWRAGAQVVWGVRQQRPGESTRHLGFARVYYFLMRRIVGMTAMPATGADSFLIDRVVIDAFRRFPERHVSVFALITWMGYRQAYVPYDKERRHSGRSGWTLRKKVRLVLDSLTAFSALPLRLLSILGAGLMTLALGVAVAAVWFLPSLGAGLLGVLAIVLGLAGVQLVALGIVGEYVWLALDEARRRPAFLIEAATSAPNSSPPAP